MRRRSVACGVPLARVLAVALIVAIFASPGDPGAKPDDKAAWGEAVGGLRLGLVVEPTTWAKEQDVTLTFRVENVSDKEVHLPAWTAGWMSFRHGLTLADDKGKAVEMGGGYNATPIIRPGVVFTVVAAHAKEEYTLTGRFAKGRLVVNLPGGGVMHWPNMGNETLKTGAYTLTAKWGGEVGPADKILWLGMRSGAVSITLTDKEKEAAAGAEKK